MTLRAQGEGPPIMGDEPDEVRAGKEPRPSPMRDRRIELRRKRNGDATGGPWVQNWMVKVP
jgi:hypothetical protein